jgi:hypothetical protein
LRTHRGGGHRRDQPEQDARYFMGVLVPLVPLKQGQQEHFLVTYFAI